MYWACCPRPLTINSLLNISRVTQNGDMDSNCNRVKTFSLCCTPLFPRGSGLLPCGESPSMELAMSWATLHPRQSQQQQQDCGGHRKLYHPPCASDRVLMLAYLPPIRQDSNSDTAWKSACYANHPTEQPRRARCREWAQAGTGWLV